jgi:hypothetical protein
VQTPAGRPYQEALAFIARELCARVS